ncbi:MAG: hypothetical protein ACLGIN_17775 [Candidatus Sericytochromatia bacterium]
MTQRLLATFTAAALLAGCDATMPQVPAAHFGLDRHGPVAAPLAAAPKHVAMPIDPPAPRVAPASTPAPSGGGGRAPAAPTLTVSSSGPSLVLADGRIVAIGAGDAVAVPEGLSGLATHFAPGRVPATVELRPGMTLHPRATALAPEPGDMVAVSGFVSPPEAGVSLYYVAPGRRSFPAGVTDEDGGFRLDVPLDGAERGVIVAKAGDRLGAVPTLLEPGVAPALPPIALEAPMLHRSDMPRPPAGLALLGASLMAVPQDAPTSFRVPLAAITPAEVPPSYVLPGFALVHGYSAESADRMRGSVTSGAPGEPAPFLAPPDLSGLPEALSPGQPLQWPAVPEATLYTVTLTGTGLTAPLWEAAVTQPAVELPRGLVLPARELVLRVDAWEAPDVTIYSVASARALRLPTSPSGASGRHSWARRRHGPAAK